MVVVVLLLLLLHVGFQGHASRVVGYFFSFSRPFLRRMMNGRWFFPTARHARHPMLRTSYVSHGRVLCLLVVESGGERRIFPRWTERVFFHIHSREVLVFFRRRFFVVFFTGVTDFSFVLLLLLLWSLLLLFLTGNHGRASLPSSRRAGCGGRGGAGGAGALASSP